MEAELRQMRRSLMVKVYRMNQLLQSICMWFRSRPMRGSAGAAAAGDLILASGQRVWIQPVRRLVLVGPVVDIETGSGVGTRPAPRPSRPRRGHR